jgi:CPW-WPC domain-containing protein
MRAAHSFAFLLLCGACADDAPSVLSDIGDVLAEHVVNDMPTSESVAAASNVMQSMARLPGPGSPFIVATLDPSLDNTCDRDYNSDCPQEFVSVGPIFGGSTSYCAAETTYAGPCDSDVFNFDGYSPSAKARWSSMCLANWPCKECVRDAQSPCPRGWGRGSGVRTCTSPSHYTGPCRGTADFAFYNQAMLSEWSSHCDAYWECA